MTRKKISLIILLFFQSFIAYLDRASIAGAVDPIKHELSLSPHMIGIVLAAFVLGYGLFQIPAGLFVDLLGPRKGLAVLVSVWSFFTAATAGVVNALQMVIIRFLFGASEAGAFPAASQAIYRHLPVKERGIAYGINFSGTRLGGAFSLFFITWLIMQVGWRMTFLINAMIGFIWVLIWLYWFRDDGNKNQDYISNQNISFKKIKTLISPSMIYIFIQYFASNFTFFIVLSWLPSYLKSHWMNNPYAIYFSALPLLLAAVSNWVASAIIFILYQKGFSAWALKLPAMIGFLLGVIGLLLATYSGSMSDTNTTLYWFVFCFSLAIFGVDMTLSPSWMYCNHLGKQYSGTLSGAMNMFGQMGGATCAILFPLMTNANMFFLLAAGINVIGVLCWCWVE